jgi:S1-C subfamily serine protease
VVAKLYVGSPAAAVGMEPRDIILTVNGANVATAQDTLTRIANVKPGKKIKVTGIRGTARFESEVEVGERPRNR